MGIETEELTTSNSEAEHIHSEASELRGYAKADYHTETLRDEILPSLRLLADDARSNNETSHESVDNLEQEIKSWFLSHVNSMARLKTADLEVVWEKIDQLDAMARNIAATERPPSHKEAA